MCCGGMVGTKDLWQFLGTPDQGPVPRTTESLSHYPQAGGGDRREPRYKRREEGAAQRVPFEGGLHVSLYPMFAPISSAHGHHGNLQSGSQSLFLGFESLLNKGLPLEGRRAQLMGLHPLCNCVSLHSLYRDLCVLLEYTQLIITSGPLLRLRLPPLLFICLLFWSIPCPSKCP